MLLTKKKFERMKLLYEAERLENSKKQLKKAVSNPSAQNTNLCELADPSKYDFEWSETISRRLESLSKEIQMLFVFQYDTAVRVSEALSIKPDDIKLDGSVYLKSKKGSFDGLVSSSRASSYLLDCKKHNRKPFDTFNRFFIYRIYKRFGVSFQSEFSKKVSVTHALRHIKAQNLKNGSVESEEITKVLRHKNPKNTEKYGKEAKNKRVQANSTSRKKRNL